ncbi:MAG: 3-dehydroquinate synthase [Phycisphaerae bacterium]|nr:3-dehydroquinate synthase [Phycisphaerae bacterium]
MDDQNSIYGGSFQVPFDHGVHFTKDLFNPANPLLGSVLESNDPAMNPRMIVVADRNMAEAWPDLEKSARAYIDAMDAPMPRFEEFLVVTGGEQAKNDMGTFDAVVEAIDRNGICRKSWVIGVGGGAMLDAVGFASATSHRGIRHVRVPTTTLSQGDAAIGVKNGINYKGKKNFLGTFSPPDAVLNDELFLQTLTQRDWIAGFAETIKIALLRDPDLFELIESSTDSVRCRDLKESMPIVKRSAELHLKHIVDGGDPFELKEARPLDFGHWSAHKLEQASDFRINHGEAVAIGLAIDCIYSKLVGRLEDQQLQRILGCLIALGFRLHDEAVEQVDVLFKGLEEFREHLGGKLTVTLLDSIGNPVDVHEVRKEIVAQAVQLLPRTECSMG